MIKTLDRVPYNYGEKSRDFQLLARLFDSSFNTSKLAIDTMLNNSGSENLDYRFVDLACRTIGFEYHGSYDTSELIAVIKSFKDMVANKGTSYAINEAVKLLLNAQSNHSSYYLDWHTDDKYLILMLPQDVKHTRLLDEIFEYILPAGWNYSLVYRSVMELDASDTSDMIVVKHKIRTTELKDADTNISDYLTEDGEMKNLDYIGQVPAEDAENKEFVSPVVNFETVISTPEKAKGE